MQRTSGMRIKLKLFKNEQVVKDTDSGKRAVIANYIRTIKWNNGYIKVSYGNDHYNDGWYKKLEDMKWALTTFTEKELVDYLKEI